MSNPIQVQIRGTETVREKWAEVKGKFDLTHAELAVKACEFILSREGEFRRYLQSEKRPTGEKD